MTRAEIIAKVEQFAAEHGWRIHPCDDDEWALTIDPRHGQEDKAGVGVYVALDDESVPIGTIDPFIDYCEGDSECAQAVADWPLIQDMVLALREALGVTK